MVLFPGSLAALLPPPGPGFNYSSAPELTGVGVRLRRGDQRAAAGGGRRRVGRGGGAAAGHLWNTTGCSADAI